MDSLLKSSAIISPCGTWRYRLDREVQADGIVYLFCGVNGSTATEIEEDQTTRKWRGFTLRNGGRAYIAINPFAFRATDVRELATAADPVGPENAKYIEAAIDEADILVPCWGNTKKVPPSLRYCFDRMLQLFDASGKPIKVFGFTQSGDPKHVLMLGYDTPLVSWNTSERR